MQSVHLRLPTAHLRLLDKLAHKLGLNRTSLIKFAIYRLGVEEGIKLEFRRGEDE